MKSRILCIIGAVLLLAGLFAPMATANIGGGHSVSFKFADGIREGEWEVYVLILLIVASIVLLLVKQHRFLLLTGILALVVITVFFFRTSSNISDIQARGSKNNFAMSWGWIVLALGSILIIIAGAIKDRMPAPSMGWGGAPPPPPYTPGR